MATADANITGKTYKAMNVEGRLREDIITFTVDNAADICDVATRLARIINVDCVSQDATGQVCTSYINSNETSNNVTGYGGQVHFTGIADTKTYELRARGW